MNKKKKGGFTLVEMIVVICIIGIITIPIMQIMDTNGKVVKMSTDKVDAKSIALLIEDQLTQELRLANSIYISSSSRPDITILNSIQSPQYIDDRPTGDASLKIFETIKGEDATIQETLKKTIIGEGMLNPFRIALNFTQQSETLMAIEIKVLESPYKDGRYNKVAYKLNFSIAPDNMQSGVVGAGTVEGVSGDKIYYTKP